MGIRRQRAEARSGAGASGKEERLLRGRRSERVVGAQG
jgi:hypothetical protein